MKGLVWKWLSLVSGLLMLCSTLQAQMPRGERTIIRGGMQLRRDTLSPKSDSVSNAGLFAELNAELAELFTADSARLTALRTDDVRSVDSLYRLELAGVKIRHHDNGGWFVPDSMGISKMSWLSLVLPGYGQLYNKQYWKLPVLYGLAGGGLALFLHESKTYKPLKREYDKYINIDRSRSPELNALQTKMIQSNTRRQLYLGLAVASYIYFIGDAAVNYATNDVSNVKKATTLACIFPGAGQIFNKSYWRVPFVVGGFATMAYIIDWNNRIYKRYKTAYHLRALHDADPEHYNNGNGPTDEFKNNTYISLDYMKNQRNNARRNRDLCIILTAGLYIFQIIDAHVDAQLQDYDISEDLSMSIEPLVDYDYVPAVGGNRPMLGFQIGVKF